MAPTGKKTSAEIDERGSDPRLAVLPERLTPTATLPAKKDEIESPPLTHSSAAPKETMKALARLLGRAAAHDMIARATATASAVPEEPCGYDQGEATR